MMQYASDSTSSCSAYFNVENSQLLPSSASLAQRQANLGASQRLNRRDQVLSQPKISRTAKQAQELAAASDKAERLYRAALVSEAKQKDSEAKAADGQSPPNDQEEILEAKRSPISLVRQIRLSVHDVGAYTPQESDTGAEASQPAAQLSAPHALSKLPSRHSLRTLRLSREVLSDEDMLDAPFSLGSSPAAQDDEEWDRRGRTRSRRGLVWLDVSQQDDGSQKTKLEDVFHEPAGHGAQEEQTLSVHPSGTAPTNDETVYGLRLDLDSKKTRDHVYDELKRTSTLALAEDWDEQEA